MNPLVVDQINDHLNNVQPKNHKASAKPEMIDDYGSWMLVKKNGRRRPPRLEKHQLPTTKEAPPLGAVAGAATSPAQNSNSKTGGIMDLGNGSRFDALNQAMIEEDSVEPGVDSGNINSRHFIKDIAGISQNESEDISGSINLGDNT